MPLSWLVVVGSVCISSIPFCEMTLSVVAVRKLQEQCSRNHCCRHHHRRRKKSPGNQHHVVGEANEMTKESSVDCDAYSCCIASVYFLVGGNGVGAALPGISGMHGVELNLFSQANTLLLVQGHSTFVIAEWECLHSSAYGIHTS